MTNPLTYEEAERIAELVKLLGEDCLIITPRELGEQLGLQPRELVQHFKKYFNGHDVRRVLAGKEAVGIGVLILYIPPDDSGPGGVTIMSTKPEYKDEYLKFKTQVLDKIQ
jgi:hypothetical protein